MAGPGSEEGRRPRLLVVNPNTSEAVTSRIAAVAAAAAGGGAEIVAGTAPSGVPFLAAPADQVLAGRGVVGIGQGGAGAAGGVVRLVSQAPTPYWTGLFEATVGEDDLRAGGFAVGGPLIAARPNELMARLSVHQSASAGFRRNLTLNADTNERDEFTTRLRLAWNPHPAWNWEGALLYSDLDNGYDLYALDNNGKFTLSDQPGRDAQESRAASLRGTYTGSPTVRFTTVTSGASIVTPAT